MHLGLRPIERNQVRQNNTVLHLELAEVGLGDQSAIRVVQILSQHDSMSQVDANDFLHWLVRRREQVGNEIHRVMVLARLDPRDLFRVNG